MAHAYFSFAGTTFPKNGQTVSVHYTGTLDNGTVRLMNIYFLLTNFKKQICFDQVCYLFQVFDSSRTRGKPFKFKIGKGEVIRGWDEGVAQLSIGQRAKLVCSPDYAYGARGHPGIIPPNATLTFDVELLRVD